MSSLLPATDVIFADNSREPAVYAVLALDQIVASHKPAGDDFITDLQYPAPVQHRQYAGLRGRAARDRVKEAAQDLDPDQLLDPTRTAAVGPPLVAITPVEWVDVVPATRGKYICVAGNQRTLLLAMAWEMWRDKIARPYLDALKSRVTTFGLSDAESAAVGELADTGRCPLLVRVLAHRDGRPRLTTLDKLAAINRRSDAAFTKARDLHTLALTIAAAMEATYAARVRRAEASGFVTADTDGGGSHAPQPAADPLPLDGLVYLAKTIGQRTPASFARSGFAFEFLDRLARTRVIPRTEHASFVNPYTHRLNAAGQYLVELVVAALAFNDPGIFDAVSQEAMKRAGGAIPSLVILRGRHAALSGDPMQRQAHMDAWDLGRDLGDALRVLTRFFRERTRHGTAALRSWRQQTDFLVGMRSEDAQKPSERAWALAAFLCLGTTEGVSKRTSAAFQVWERVATEAAAASKLTAQGELFAGVHDADAIFEERFVTPHEAMHQWWPTLPASEAQHTVSVTPPVRTETELTTPVTGELQHPAEAVKRLRGQELIDWLCGLWIAETANLERPTPAWSGAASYRRASRTPELGWPDAPRASERPRRRGPSYSEAEVFAAVCLRRCGDNPENHVARGALPSQRQCQRYLIGWAADPGLSARIAHILPGPGKRGPKASTRRARRSSNDRMNRPETRGSPSDRVVVPERSDESAGERGSVE